ncbi:MAG TPA: hemerythrin domain-containing protein [Rhodocyclaceae bacterium]|nr:hemerythrin domain-containing protein [Rhodocyclaceae bacterium]
MPLMWSRSLETGIREIDLQHQELLEIGNEVERRARDGGLDEAVRTLLPRLASYVLFHFATEERLVSGLPGAAAHLAAHVAEHRAFADRVGALREGSPGVQELLDFVDYLHGWLAGHICHADRELAALVRKAQGERAASRLAHAGDNGVR